MKNDYAEVGIGTKFLVVNPVTITFFAIGRWKIFISSKNLFNDSIKTEFLGHSEYNR